MGHDAVRGPNTYGSGCMPGCQRQFVWWRENYDAGSLGCYNPASLGGRSLHAEGRAMDIALNAHDPAERARGDAIFDRVMANPDQFGAQEMLFRGYLWSYQRRSEGKRGPGIQQADHMNHVHLGIDVDAARNWDPSWVKDGPPSPPKLDEIPIGDDMYLAYQILKPTGHGAFLTNGVICAPILNDDLASLRKDPKVVYAQLSQAAHDNIQKQCDEARKA